MSARTSSLPQQGDQAIRGFAPWSPRPKSQAIIEQVEKIIAEYEKHLPLTIRQIFYRLVGAYDYPKDKNAYDRLINYLGRARRAKMIPFNAIRDDGVTGKIDHQYGGLADFHDETARRARRYRLNRQGGQSQYVELWCEAAGMVHQLERVALPYSVPVWSGGGFDSLTAKYEIARRALEREVPTVILHLGDFDPDGENLFRAVIEDAAAFVEEDRTLYTERIEYVRVALTAKQIKMFELDTDKLKSAKKGSARATINERWRARHGDVTCQLEALPPDALAELVKAAIVDHLDSDTYEHRLDVEHKDRASLLALPRGTA